jgi:hypothetical protein
MVYRAFIVVILRKSLQIRKVCNRSGRTCARPPGDVSPPPARAALIRWAGGQPRAANGLARVVATRCFGDQLLSSGRSQICCGKQIGATSCDKKAPAATGASDKRSSGRALQFAAMFPGNILARMGPIALGKRF